MGRTTGKGQKPKHKTFCLNIGKDFFTVRVTRQWHRFPKVFVEPSSLEILKHHFDVAMGNLLYMALLEQKGVDQMTYRGLFYPQPDCESVIIFTLV